MAVAPVHSFLGEGTLTQVAELRFLGLRISAKRAWPYPVPTGQNQNPEQGIAKDEYPGRRLVVNKFIDPVGNERSVVHDIACL